MFKTLMRYMRTFKSFKSSFAKGVRDYRTAFAGRWLDFEELIAVLQGSVEMLLRHATLHRLEASSGKVITYSIRSEVKMHVF